LFLLPELKQNSETKADNTSVRQFFAKPFVKHISCFCFFGTKKSLTNFAGQKREVSVNVPGLAKNWHLKSVSRKPKLNL